ncbi:MAG: carboxymuconolactone decarboxylase family protein [Planctomycetota bacterium]|nr:MAG: carboxymuconolactone decarboxylase family protein [Planctomycetota bacterium]
MPRMKVIGPDEAQGEVKAVFEDVARKMGTVPAIFQGMANSPAALKAYLAMSEALAGGQLAPEDREVIYLAVSENNGCHYCASAHTMLAQRVGLSAEEALAARQFASPDSSRDALLKFVRRVIETRGFVDDDDLAAVRDAGYSDGQIAESIAYIGLATYSNLFNHVHDTPLDFPPAPRL